MRASTAVTVLIAALVATGGCGGNKPEPNQVYLMPAPGIYEESRIRGHLVWAHESRSFTACGGERHRIGCTIC